MAQHKTHAAADHSGPATDISVRQWYAGCALQGLLAGRWLEIQLASKMPEADHVARTALAIADALLAEEAKPAAKKE